MKKIYEELTTEEQDIVLLLTDALQRFRSIDDAISLEHQKTFERAIRDAKHVLVMRALFRIYGTFE